MKLKYCVVLTLFILAGALTFICRFQRHWQARPLDLSAIPTVVGDWSMINQENRLKGGEIKFLDNVLCRSYQRKDGRLLFLTIAYGADQRKKFSLHQPEICYKSAGCEVVPVGLTDLDSPRIKVKQLLVRDANGEFEAVQYWVVVGGEVVTSQFNRNLKHIYNNYFGKDAGGALIRVASITTAFDYQKEYGVQKEFIAALRDSLAQELRRICFGIIRDN
ncbi:MAG TPA: EpsI family protein [Geobacteraceae bacterium]|nr:EpsI family protein [Geobacteraceae bacterium]